MVEVLFGCCDTENELQCNTIRLRAVNLFVGLPLIFYLSRCLVRRIALGKGKATGDDVGLESRRERGALVAAPGANADHVAFNISLFPPLFFFVALYYTDVLSAAVVLLAYDCFLAKRRIAGCICGLTALWMRQTNVFWVGIFFGGEEVIRVLKGKRGTVEQEDTKMLTNDDSAIRVWARIARESWKAGKTYDPLVTDAWLEGNLDFSSVPSSVPSPLPSVIPKG